MSDQLTPREHEDMPDLQSAGTRRIRPAVSRRTWILVGVIAFLVAGTVGGVVASAQNTAPQDDSPADAVPTRTVAPTPVPTWTVPEEPKGFDPAALQPSLPGIASPAEGEHVTPLPDPTQDERVMLGTRSWLDQQGIDYVRAQGFQRVGGIQAWTAPLKDGTGSCVLIRTNFTGGGFSEVACEAAGVPAQVERDVDGTLLRFTIIGSAIDVYAVPQ
ncbi:hypothetical protein ABZ477_03270 [Microbacterium sp. NPDC019599]|uniref:hypothetical protein n=1 Tax=Microbacterium sp. NPDC019599 TaxID=3154690 RepID=UPI0033E4B201